MKKLGLPGTKAVQKTIVLDPCMGIPVRYSPSLETISESRGLWHWKKIFVGPKFLAFPPREQQAMLLHEVGHCKLRHLERRLLGLWRIVWPPALLRLCVLQEHQADLFAKHCGYGSDLARAFQRVRPARAGYFHPPVEERITRLLS